MVGRTLPSVLGGMLLSARAGSLEAPAEPTEAGSAMFSLDDIYNKLDTRQAVGKRAGAFAEPDAGPTAGTMHTLDQIMGLVTNRAPVAKSGQKVAYAAGDDGALQIGVAPPQPRFTIGTEGEATNCVTDNLTGLMWARDANLFGKTNWFDAVTNCNDLVFGGYDDWRLPNVRELISLVDYNWSNPAICNTAGTAKWAKNDPFRNLVQGVYYWSSTVYQVSTAQALAVFIGYSGIVNNHGKTTLDYVLPVRGGGD